MIVAVKMFMDYDMKGICSFIAFSFIKIVSTLNVGIDNKMKKGRRTTVIDDWK